jgi:hypothetical protein
MSKTLRILNGLCMVIQGGFCALWIKKKNDNYIIPQDLKVYTTSIQNINGTIKTVIKEKENSFIKKDLRDLLIAFFGITAAVHTFYLISSFDKVPLIGGVYNKMIANKNNYIRWIEYSITATLMINIVARSAGVSDEDTLVLCNLATVAVMLQGQTIELALKEKPSSTKLQQLIIYNLVGWGLMIGVFAIIISKFQQTIDEIKAATCAKIPDFVKYIIYSQAAFYMSFGLLQFIQILTVYNNPDYDYEKFEIGYNVLSLLSKTTLGSILGFGIDQSSGRDNDKTYPPDCNQVPK